MTNAVEPKPEAVLFACNLNSVRSPMAGALMALLYGQSVYVETVGVEAREIDPFVVVVMAERGIDVSNHLSKSFDMLTETTFDLIVCLTPEAQIAANELARTQSLAVEYWPTSDPTHGTGSREQRLEAYRQLCTELEGHLMARFGTPDLRAHEG